MRTVTLALLSLALAATALADVRLGIKKDGSKVIYNVGGGPTGRAGDLKWLARQHDRRTRYDDIIERYASRYGVDPVLVRAVIQVESNFNPNCVSNKGARGLMQLMPGTAKQYGIKQMHDPEENIRGGIRHLAYLLDLFPNDLHRALAAYNAGENAVLKYGGIPPYEETTAYVKRALTVYYGRPYGEGAVSLAGSRTGKKLRGGLGSAFMPPVAAALLPGMKYLGTR
ncbi:MAG TPA: lytic transglycosylase domain-containing protein [Thermoanaerobaculia bacterium]|nr:lytic transglycosylase domain-containing protein [Thermoanaerobaculia bacterium]